MRNRFSDLLAKGLLVICFCFAVFSSFATDEYNGRIKGTITTVDGKPAAWVTVHVKNSGISAITDENGVFIFKNLRPGNYTLVISYSGSEASEKTIKVTDDDVAKTEFTLHQTAKELNEVIIDGRKSSNLQPVTIGKIPVAPMDLPQSITIIGQSAIRDQQSQRLSDVMKNVNGIYLSTTRGSAQETFAARGYRLSGDNMFKNGARVNSGVMPEMSSLEKVEILKGSAAILYGDVAPGGIINMVTKKPRFDFGGEISMRAGSYDLYKPAFDVYGPLSQKIAFRVNGTYEDAGNFRDEVHSKRYYINPSVLFNINKKTSLLVEADYLNHEFTPDFGLGSLDNTIIADLPRSTFQGVSWQYNKAKQATATASLKHKLNNAWNLNLTGSYQSYDRDYYSLERIQAAANGDWQRPLNKILSAENYYLAQADVTGKFKTSGIDHTLLAGIDADRNFITSYTFDNPKTYDIINILDHSKFTPRTDIPSASKVTRAQTPVNRIGAYVQDLISVSNKIKLLAGVRWSKQIAQSVTTTYLAKDSIGKDAGQDDQAFSPRFGIVYKPLASTAVFASYSNSFSVNKGTDVFNNALTPSLIDQYELGVKNDLFNGQLSVNVTAYRIVNNNLAQTAQFERDGVTPNNNSAFKELTGQTTSDGIELDIMGHPVKGLDIIAGYSYNNMRYTKTPDTKGSYVEGERLVGTPANTANGSAFYTFQNKLKGLKIGTSVFFVGERFAGWNNTKDQTQNYSRLIPVNGFTTLDISAGYSFKKISLLAKVSNVGNTYNYYVHENYSINPIPPTQFIGTVSYRF
ncbi:MAG TPA: TonB-dependent receptor [Hanamia sp.]|nr:TonB-dependent receptor [Hanamia sp.]